MGKNWFILIIFVLVALAVIIFVIKKIIKTEKIYSKNCREIIRIPKRLNLNLISRININ